MHVVRFHNYGVKAYYLRICVFFSHGSKESLISFVELLES